MALTDNFIQKWIKKVPDIESQLVGKANTLGISYAQFGAKGDGITNDYEAIYNTHVYANTHRCKVFGDGTKTYLIGDRGDLPTIPVETDVDWCGAFFIIDNTNLTKFNDVFDIGNKSKTNVQANGNITIGQVSTDLPDGIYSFYDSRVKQFIRSGINSDNGCSQQETVVVLNGKIITDITQNINYDSYDYKTVEKDNLIINNATFITREKESSYNNNIYRGIRVTRSNVTFDNIVHKKENKIEYDTNIGFIIVDMVYNTIIKRSLLTRHKKNDNSNTYEINLTKSAKIIFDNVIIDNLKDITTEWHSMISNNCKDIEVNNCELDVIDAHMGVTNLTVKNSIIGEVGIAVVGWGRLTVYNSTIMNQYVVSLRGDYGSFWNGDIELKNISHKCKYGTPWILGYKNDGVHNYGYDTFCGKSIAIENYINNDENLDITYNYLLNVDSNYIGSGERQYPLIFPNKIDIKNVKASKGYRLFNGNLENVIMNVNHVYVDVEKYSKENMVINIENMPFYQFSSGVGNGNILNTEFTNLALFNNNLKICYPKIIISNCESFWCNTKGYPMLINLNNTSLKTFILFGSNTSYTSKATIDNCIFNINPSAISSYVKANYEYVVFRDCTFNLNGSYSIEELRTIFTFIDYLKVSGITKKLIGYFYNCNMWDGFDWTLNGDYSAYGFDMNEEFKSWHSKTCKTV